MEDLAGLVTLLGQRKASLRDVAVDHVYDLERLWVDDERRIEARDGVIGGSHRGRASNKSVSCFEADNKSRGKRDEPHLALFINGDKEDSALETFRDCAKVYVDVIVYHMAGGIRLRSGEGVIGGMIATEMIRTIRVIVIKGRIGDEDAVFQAECASSGIATRQLKSMKTAAIKT
ncbi:hypothetical protein ACLOJK_032767 [Asimina triloba]